MNIPAILTRNYPGAQWVLNGDDYEGLEWLDDSPKPTKKALEQAWPAVDLAVRTEAVERARQAAYRETADPIFFEYQAGEASQSDWKEARNAVKQQHPYPEA
jgi:hypothetical protein